MGVYARPVNGGGNIVGFCIGAYVYCDEIYIEVSELMELLKYEADDNCYLPSSNTVNLRLYANSVNILNGGVWFDALYDDCLGSETAGFVTSLLYHVLTGNYGDYFSSSDYNKDDEMVESVKKMLYDRCYPVSAENLDIPSDYAAALTELSSLISDGTSAIGMTMESLSKLIAGAPGASRIYESLGICFSNFSENVASEADGLWKNVEFGSLVLEEVILVVSLQFKYEENIAILDLLIEEETNPRVVSIYEKVKSELDVYYANKALGLLNTLVTNPKIRDTFVANTVDELKDFAESGIQFTNPYLVAYKLTVFVADDILNGEALYDAQNGIYRMHNSLELYMPSLADAIDDYYNNPTKQNEQRLLAVASVAAHMRLLATDYCIEYLESKMFNNDTEAFEMEKESIEHYIKNLNSLYDALS